MDSMFVNHLIYTPPYLRTVWQYTFFSFLKSQTNDHGHGHEKEFVFPQTIRVQKQ